MLYYSFRSLVVRWRQSAACALIVAVATGIILTLSTAVDSFSELLAITAEPENLVVVMRGGFAEKWPEVSHIAPETIGALREMRMGESTGGSPLISPEVFATGQITVKNLKPTRVSVRGVDRNAFEVHRSVVGEPPRNGILVGRGVQKLLRVSVGDEVEMLGRKWTVEGFFNPRARQTQYDSEIWVPLDALMRIRNTQDYSFAAVKTDSPAEVRRIVGVLNATNAGLLKEVRAVPERAMGGDAEAVVGAFRVIYIVLSVLVVIATGLGTLNVLLQSVFRRRRHMALFRAMGFGGLAISGAFMVEGFVIALAGALLGTLAVLPLSGRSFVTGAISRPGVTVVTLHFTLDGVLQAILIGVALGCICSLLPAWYSSRFRVKDELRAE